MLNDLGPFIVIAISVVLALLVLGFVVRMARRSRIRRLYRRRTRLEAEVADLKPALGSATAPAGPAAPPKRDTVACFFCAEPVARQATVCPHCLRPAAHNLKAFVRNELARREQLARTGGAAE